YPRHPAGVAASAWTAAGLIDGRLRLGIGVSHQAAMEGRLGIPWDRPARHMEEYLEILLPLLRGERVRYRGSMLSANLSLAIPPTAPCPVYLAALQPRMLQLAGSLADGTITWCTGPITIAEQVAPGITEAARNAGRPAPRVVVALPVCVSDDAQHGRDVANQLLDGYGQLPVYRAVLDREGVQDPGDIAVVGNERAVTAQIERLFAAGATDFVAIPCGSDDDRRRSFDHLASLL
ncbi:MAG: TIGR03564 family F420-dependent LLM class oxidoreductase, partial [Acidimicrobiia bacterium]